MSYEWIPFSCYVEDCFKQNWFDQNIFFLTKTGLNENEINLKLWTKGLSNLRSELSLEIWAHVEEEWKRLIQIATGSNVLKIFENVLIEACWVTT